MTAYTPHQAVAASVPTPTPRLAGDTAYNNARLALDTDAVAIVHRVHEGRVWFLAAAAADLAGAPSGATCPLAAALPGSPEHMGWGLYLTRGRGSQLFAAISTGDGLEGVFTGTEPELQAIARRRELPVIEAAGSQPWEAYRFLVSRPARRAAQLAFGVSLVLAAASGATLIALLHITAAREPAAQATAADVGAAVAAFNRQFAAQPPLAPLASVQTLAAQVPRPAGRIVFYKFEDGQTSWQVEVPPWADVDSLRKLGGSSVRQQDDGNLIVDTASEAGGGTNRGRPQ